MKQIRLHDKYFRVYKTAAEIDREIGRVAQELNRDLAGKRPLFISVLNGSFMFTSDLLKQITVEGTEVAFIRVASYAGTTSSGEIRELMGLTVDVADRCVVLLEDIVDTGRSLLHLNEMLRPLSPRELLTASLFYKPDALICDVTVDYYGIAIDNAFVVGRGLDYDNLGRHLPDLYVIDENE